ncbi:nuclear transport factor 2 family protein [Erythrobacter sp. JK5]|uniref:nuclear transport factor 2 family protein n=1 Tax=Erythrobacter sp. JK5 TaxID=2829500 RepID=UPI001BAD6590|nr:nuclear transport factor 2 family protein [Erythrobacter sp. JK5]QUL37871.1 nuclear transport factor 2 family protein [Erythrobacter sp. JK5]
MRGLPIRAAALALAAPALADHHTTPEQDAVAEAVTDFMDAISSDDRTLLTELMVPEGMIFVHDRMDPDNPRLAIVPVAEHVERWKTRTADYEEVMNYSNILVDGDMAQVWGPYSFTADGTLTHCGINSLSLVKRDGEWKVGNTSFTMVAPSECMAVGADWVEGDDS